MIKKLLAEYIVCGIAPALPKESLIKFYNKSLQTKIGFLLRADKIKQVNTKDFDERVISYALGLASDNHNDLPMLEAAVIKQFLGLLENKHVMDNTFLWRSKPTIKKTDKGFESYFRGAFICK